MEQKIVRVPFNMETAKRIQNKECAGKIITRVGGEVRNVVFDLKNEECPICAIVETDIQKEDVMLYLKDGSFRKGCTDDLDLMLEIPEIFKEYELKPFDKVLVRDSITSTWYADLYANYNPDEDYKYVTIGGVSWKYCIPYNEQTAHLLGKTDNWEG